MSNWIWVGVYFAGLVFTFIMSVRIFNSLGKHVGFNKHMVSDDYIGCFLISLLSWISVLAMWAENRGWHIKKEEE